MFAHPKIELSIKSIVFISVGVNRAGIIERKGERVEKERRRGNITETYLTVKNITIINQAAINEQNLTWGCYVRAVEVVSQGLWQQTQILKHQNT